MLYNGPLKRKGHHIAYKEGKYDKCEPSSSDQIQTLLKLRTLLTRADTLRQTSIKTYQVNFASEVKLSVFIFHDF